MVEKIKRVSWQWLLAKKIALRACIMNDVSIRSLLFS
jgi:hypothetical protein